MSCYKLQFGNESYPGIAKCNLRTGRCKHIHFYGQKVELLFFGLYCMERLKGTFSAGYLVACRYVFLP